MLSLARRLVILEIGIWRSLLLWATRRVPGMVPGVQAFPYARQVIPILWALIVLSLIELPVVHLLLPWDTIRLVVLVLSVWGLLWMVGLLASLKVFPHLIDDAGLRIRDGTTADFRVPWEAVASVTARRGSVPTGKTVQIEETHAGTTLVVAVLKQTRVDVVLREPTGVALPGGPQAVDRVRLYADAAAAFVTAARERLATTSAR